MLRGRAAGVHATASLTEEGRPRPARGATFSMRSVLWQNDRRMRTATLLVLALLSTACSALVGFDRDRITDGGGIDAPMGTCNPTTHAGCGANELCCESGGQPTCVPTGAGQCTACGVACDAQSSSACVNRTCRCGDGPACSGEADLCDDASGSCIECRDDTDCAGSEVCVQGQCSACDPTDDSGCSGTTPICDDATRTCRGCTASDCVAPQTCADTGECVGCTDNANCTARTAPICNAATMTCRGCTNATDCMTELGRAFCLADGRCTDCNPTDNAGCTGTTPVCRTTGGMTACVACTTDGDCAGRAGTPVCAQSGANAGACVACDAEDSSVCAALGQTCDVANNRCVQCLMNAQCSGTTPICDGGTCRACTASDCTAPSVCVTSGPLTGACGACNPAATNVCPAATPVCAASTATCVGCTESAQCAGLTGGPTCVVSTGRCAVCDPTSNAGCSGTTPFCSGSTTCRPCATNVECNALRPGNICTTAGSCAACDPSNNAGCTATGTQPVCDATSLTCRGCSTNPDCTGNASGTVCVTSGTSTGACRTCNPGTGTTSGCSGGTPTCSSAFACVACETNANCPAGGFDCVSGQCECRTGTVGNECRCSMGNNCTPGQTCNLATGTCTTP